MKEIPKFIKIATISAVGLVPGQLKSQDVIKDTINPQHKIEYNEQLKHKIFDQVEIGFLNGILRNDPNSAYFFRLKKNGYDITYDLDANSDNLKDEKPTIQIDYVDGNSNYILSEGSQDSKDVVVNYKDNMLSNSTTKTYEEFFAENKIVIESLYGKNMDPVNFRKISDEEKQKFLNELKLLMGSSDPDGIKNNDENIKKLEGKMRLEKEKEAEEKQIVETSSQLLDYLRNNKNLKGKKFDEIRMMDTLSLGIYSLRFDVENVYVSFVDSEGYKNEIFVDTNTGTIKRARKLKEIEGKYDIKYLSNTETERTMKEVLLGISK